MIVEWLVGQKLTNSIILDTQYFLSFAFQTDIMFLQCKADESESTFIKDDEREIKIKIV